MRSRAQPCPPRDTSRAQHQSIIVSARAAAFMLITYLAALPRHGSRKRRA